MFLLDNVGSGSLLQNGFETKVLFMQADALQKQHIESVYKFSNMNLQTTKNVNNMFQITFLNSSYNNYQQL